MLTGQIEQWVFAVEGKLGDEPTAHKAVSVGLNAGCVGFQEIILLEIRCAVGKRGKELLHARIGQVLIGIAFGNNVLFTDIAGRRAMRAPDNSHTGKIRAQLLDIQRCSKM